jgi:hypothetical protein
MSSERLSKLQKFILVEAYKNKEHPEYGKQVRSIEKEILDNKNHLIGLEKFPFHPGRMGTKRRIRALEERMNKMIDLGLQDGRQHYFITKSQIYEKFFGLKADQPVWSSGPIKSEKAFFKSRDSSTAKKIVILSRSLASLKDKGLICSPDGKRFSAEIILTENGIEKAKSIIQKVYAGSQFELYNKKKIRDFRK